MEVGLTQMDGNENDGGFDFDAEEVDGGFSFDRMEEGSRSGDREEDGEDMDFF